MNKKRRDEEGRRGQKNTVTRHRHRRLFSISSLGLLLIEKAVLSAVTGRFSGQASLLGDTLKICHLC